MKSVVLFFLLIVSSKINAQFIGVRSYFNAGTKLVFTELIATADSNVIVLGRSQTNSQDNLASVLKTDANGSIEWQSHKLIHFTSWVKGVTFSDGSFIVGLIDINIAPNYIVIAKFDITGNVIWKRKMSFMDVQFITGICMGINNTVLVTGRTTQSTSSINDFWTAQFDTSGVLLNSHQYHNQAAGYNTWPSNIIAVTNGAVAIGKYGSFSGSNVNPNIFKFDGTGTLLWSKTFPGISFSQFSSYVIESSTGDLFFYFYNQTDTIYLWKTTATGNTIWLKKIEYSGASGGSFLINRNDELVMMNNFAGNFDIGVNFLVVDLDGNLLRSHYYPNYYGTSCVELADGRIAFSGNEDRYDTQILGYLGPSEQLSCYSSTLNVSIVDIPFSAPVSLAFNDINQCVDLPGYLIHYNFNFQDSVFCRLDSTVSVFNLTEKEFEVYFSNQNSAIILESPQSCEIGIKVYSMNGQLICSKSNQMISEGTNTIPLNMDMNRGIYFIKVESEKINKGFKFCVQ